MPAHPKAHLFYVPTTRHRGVGTDATYRSYDKLFHQFVLTVPRKMTKVLPSDGSISVDFFIGMDVFHAFIEFLIVAGYAPSSIPRYTRRAVEVAMLPTESRGLLWAQVDT